MINLQDYITHSHLFRTIKADDLLFVNYECLIDDRKSEIWSHTNYLAYVVGGQKKWKTHNREFLVKSGEILFVKKGANTVYQYFEEPFFVLFVFMPDDFIRNLLFRYEKLVNHHKDHQSNHEDLFLVHRNEVMDAFFKSLKSYFSRNARVPKELLKLKMEELILNLLTQPGNQSLKSYFASLGQGKAIELEQIMNANVHHPFTIMDYARLSARSLASFRRDFKRVYHTTPGKWLLEKRLEYGRLLLETTDRTINEVVDDCGFKNRSHFLKSFKHAYGVSPGQYRNLRIIKKTG